MAKGIIRTERWALKSSEEQRMHAAMTLNVYRDYVRALIGVVYTHWPAISGAKSRCAAVEALMHPTKDRPEVRYQYFRRRFHRFPSYLRRAAIEAACGAVESFISRYGAWCESDRRREPPRLAVDNALNPPLYRGQCVRFDERYGSAEIKLWNGREWAWSRFAITSKRKRHLLPGATIKSPQLLMRRGHIVLGVPIELPRARRKSGPALAVDLGLNTAAVLALVAADGTVTARRFVRCAADNARRDKGLARLSKAARKTGKLDKGFACHLYRKARNRNRQAALTVARTIIRAAHELGAGVIVFENLKGFRPRGGRRRSGLRARFHGWLHRMIVQRVQDLAEEAGLGISFVNPAGTSKYAFDGSGEVKRDKANASLCTFASGKRYNTDLNAAYNIGARYWVRKLRGGNDPQAVAGKCSRPAPRIPVTLSTLWALTRVAEREAPSKAPSGA